MRLAFRTGLLLVLMILPDASVPAADLDARHARLQTIPLERRRELEQNLKEFDALPSEERSRIRSLDQQIQDLPAGDRQRLYTLMRTYHDWLRALPEKSRNKIVEAPAGQRIALINEIRAQQNKARPKEGSSPAIQVSSLVRDLPRHVAVELEFWFSLAPEERDRILKQPNPDRQRGEFQALTRKSQVFQRLQNEQDRQFRRDMAALREGMRNREPGVISRLRPFEIPKTPPKDRSDSLRRAVEMFFLADFQPEPVSLRNLDRFEAALPPWVRADALPPDAAKKRLVILYRLTFPSPRELPEPTPASAKPKGATQPHPAAPASPSGANNPF